MSFSNTQLTKNMTLQLFITLRIHKNVIFKYAISKKHVIIFLYNLLIYDVF